MTRLQHPDAESIQGNIVIRKAKLQDAVKIHEVLMQAFKGLEGREYSTQAIETAIVDRSIFVHWPSYEGSNSAL